jgi:hypothetical protein
MLLLLGFVSGVTGGSMVGRRGILNAQKR